MTLKTCVALIITLIATTLVVGTGASGCDIDAAGVLVKNTPSSAVAPEKDAKRVGPAELTYPSNCYAPRLMGSQLVASTNGLGTGRQLVGSSRAMQIACARG